VYWYEFFSGLGHGGAFRCVFFTFNLSQSLNYASQLGKRFGDFEDEVLTVERRHLFIIRTLQYRKSKLCAD
jgi:hypothetical protein